MPKHHNLIMTITISLLLVIAMTGCGPALSGISSVTPTPTLRPTPTPTPIPIPMVRITIQLVDVLCDHKQDAFGFHDKFYMMTTFAAPASGSNPKARLNTQAQLSLPLDITSGQDLELPQSHLLVFNGLVPLQGSIRGGFTAYNDKQGLTWQKINYWVSNIAKSVGNQLLEESFDSGNIELIAALAVLDLGVNAWYKLANLTSDNSNQLGKQDLVVQASGPPSQDGVLHFYNPGGWFGVGGWDYSVRYHITRSLVTS